jgi:hypothetical protein
MVVSLFQTAEPYWLKSDLVETNFDIYTTGSLLGNKNFSIETNSNQVPWDLEG